MRRFAAMVLSTGLFLASLPQAFATKGSVEASGQVFYKMPESGEIVKRDATLVVPSRGQGDVILRGEKIELVADRFFSVQNNNQTIFYVVFNDYPGRQEGEEAVYRGTYVRGTNLAFYYGDVFTVSKTDLDDHTLDTVLSSGAGSHEISVEYSAGFYFKTPIITE